VPKACWTTVPNLCRVAGDATLPGRLAKPPIVTGPTSGGLREWTRRLRDRHTDITTLPGLDPIERDAQDSPVGFAAEHARRYIASNGADDGWDGPRPILLLYTRGRRSGLYRRIPLLYFEHNGAVHVIGSAGGSDNSPAWHRNIEADPRVYARIMDRFFAARAVSLEGAERTTVFNELIKSYPVHAEYQRRTSRLIPIVRIVPCENSDHGG
jgi:deazaflavin-dependent oxidoreductase (nitroreductase family)